MRKKIKRGVLGLLIIATGCTIAFFSYKAYTKSHSPEERLTYRKEALKIEAFYSRPYKKGRTIFGKLVPYGKTWRTGANEATTIEVNKDILVDGSSLESGKYTLWTIPDKNSWKLIFNKKMYAWGIDLTSEEAARDKEYDALVVEVPVKSTPETVEQFSITIKEKQQLIFLKLAWDDTLVEVPLREK